MQKAFFPAKRLEQGETHLSDYEVHAKLSFSVSLC